MIRTYILVLTLHYDDDDTNEDKTRLAFVHLWKRGGVCLLLVCPTTPRLEDAQR